ncbi:MAG: tRNA (guanosine(46)-N7)-methyltransferase TrmB [Bacteriovoracia bacterium]
MQNPYLKVIEEFSKPENTRIAFEKTSPKGWRSYFERERKVLPRQLVVEIGCSFGVFLSEVAQKNPNCGFVGIDWKFKAIAKAATRAHRVKIDNLALVRMNAQEIDRYFDPGEIDELWIFFPDPWAKSSQKKHRLLNPDFFKKVHSLLSNDGKVYFKTDHPGYFQSVLKSFGYPVPEISHLYEAQNPNKNLSLEPKSRILRQVKVRRTEELDLIKVDSILSKLFSVENVSTDYLRSKNEGLMFSEVKTSFEKRFNEQELPIYFIEFKKQKTPPYTAPR